MPNPVRFVTIQCLCRAYSEEWFLYQTRSKWSEFARCKSGLRFGGIALTTKTNASKLESLRIFGASPLNHE